MTSTKVPQFARLSENAYKKYEAAVQKLRLELTRGKTYDQACDSLTDLDQSLKVFVRDEFLKTIIAEEHFGAGVEISDIALLLGLPYEKVESTLLTLLNDMVREAAQHRTGENKTIN